MTFTPRLLATALDRPPLSKVAVVEGARAVGKTTLVKRDLVAQGLSYSTLADPATLALARADVTGWVGRLELPAIVDEAQLLPELPLAVKERVDTLPPGRHIVLTGSASIGRSGLGGADPLTRRARRFTLWPLTGWELAGGTGSLADCLFDAEPAVGQTPGLDDQALLAMMAVGGFPDYALADPAPTVADMARSVASDLASLFTHTVLPGADFSAVRATAVCQALMTTPGAIFNASRIGQTLGFDRRTVDNYLGLLGRLFCVHWLNNLATAAPRQSYTRAKVHPVDSSLAVAALTRAGVDILGAREAFGQVMESWAVNQIVASAGWSQLGQTAHFWRQAAGDREVDLVLTDVNGRRVGVEVKAGRVYDSNWLKGLRSLEAAGGLHRGFVVYAGSEVYPLDRHIWLTPVTALADPSVWRSV
jgi:predicted AAA+ superfamily ATPase